MAERPGSEDMRTYTEFTEEHEGMYLWDCDAGDIDGHRCLDALAYETQEDLDADDDNTLAVARETVIDDR